MDMSAIRASMRKEADVPGSGIVRERAAPSVTPRGVESTALSKLKRDDAPPVEVAWTRTEGAPDITWWEQNAQKHSERMLSDPAYREAHNKRLKSDPTYRRAFTQARSNALSRQYNENGIFSWGTKQSVNAYWHDRARWLAETGRGPNAITASDAAQQKVDNEILHGKTYATAEDNAHAQKIREKLNAGSNVKGNTAYVDLQRAIDVQDANIRSLSALKQRTPAQKKQLAQLKHDRAINYTELNNFQRRLDMQGGGAWRTMGAAGVQNIIGAAGGIDFTGALGLDEKMQRWLGVDNEAQAATGVLTDGYQQFARAAGAFAGDTASMALLGGVGKLGGKILKAAPKVTTAMPILNARMPMRAGATAAKAVAATPEAVQAAKKAVQAAKLSQLGARTSQRLTGLNTAAKTILTPTLGFEPYKYVLKGAGAVAGVAIPVSGAYSMGSTPTQIDAYNGATTKDDFARDQRVAGFTRLDADSQQQIIRAYAQQRASAYANRYIASGEELSPAAARYNYLKHYSAAGANVNADSALIGLDVRDIEAIKSLDGAPSWSRRDQVKSYNYARNNARVETQDRAGIKNEGTYWNIHPFRQSMQSQALKDMALRKGTEEAVSSMTPANMETMYDNRDKKQGVWRCVNQGMSGLREPDKARGTAAATEAATNRAWQLFKEDPFKYAPDLIALYAKTKGYGANVTDFLRNPLTFYGGLAGILGGGGLLLGSLLRGRGDDDEDDEDDRKLRRKMRRYLAQNEPIYQFGSAMTGNY